MLKIEPNIPIEEKFNILIPIDYTLDEKGAFTVTAYESFKHFAEEFIKKFAPENGGDPFGNDAMEWLYRTSEQDLKELGYTADRKRMNVWVKNYDLTQRDKLDESLIRADSELLDPEKKYKNLTTFDLDDRFDMEQTACGTLQNGQLVSIAAENTSFDDDGSTEISTETAPQYRGHGYAKSNVALISKQLLKEYSKINYKCTRYNVKSQAVAEAVGFDYRGRSFYLCAYNEE